MSLTKILFTIGLGMNLALAADEDLEEMSLQCPRLTCEKNDLEPNVCYQHDSKPSAEYIKGNLCYDVESAKQSDNVLVCPFDTTEYMWIDEYLQG